MAGRIGYYGGVVADSLNFLLDAAKKDSYSGTGTVSRDLTGRFGSSLLFNEVTFSNDGLGGWVFDGINDYILLPTNIYTQNDSPFSVSVWFKSTATAGGTIFAQQNNPDPSTSTAWIPAIYLGTTGLIRTEVFWTGSQANAFISTAAYNDGFWHQVCVTYGNGTQSTYIDGILAGKVTGKNQASYTSTYYYFLGGGYAADRGLGAYFFKGSIAQFAFYNRLLSASEVEQNYSSGFSRNPYPLDFNARAFLTIAGITNSTIITAINTFVIELKGANLWNKMKALYPFVGGLASTHKYNLRDPRDSDDAFRLTFVGGMTHSSNGVTFNGTNGYANTYVNPTKDFVLNSTHMAIYSRTSAARITVSSTETGQGPGFNNMGLSIRRSNNIGSYIAAVGNSDPWLLTATVSDGSGFFIGTNTSIVDQNFYRNTTLLATRLYFGSPIGANQTFTDYNFYLGAGNNTNVAGGFADFNCALASYGEGLNTTDLAAYNTIVQNFQTTLGRQV